MCKLRSRYVYFLLYFNGDPRSENCLLMTAYFNKENGGVGSYI